MSVLTKKWVGKKKGVAAKIGKRRRATKAAAGARDRAERKKIGKTLDVAAFMADFQRDTTSAAYWESKDD